MCFDGVVWWFDLIHARKLVDIKKKVEINVHNVLLTTNPIHI